VWDLAQGRCTAVLRGHTDRVEGVAVTANGRRAVSGADDKTVRVWDLVKGCCTAVLDGHTDLVNGVAVTADGRRAVSGAWDKTVRVWDLVKGCCTAVLREHTGQVQGVAVTADGRRAISKALGGNVRVWDLAKGLCIASHVDGSEESGAAWAMTQRGQVAADIEPFSLTLRATVDGVVLARFPGSFTNTNADCSADGRHVVAGDGYGGVYILKLHMRGG
jgi:WD40 repeat protein